MGDETEVWPRVFVRLGFVYVGGIVVPAVFLSAGIYNLTAVEPVPATSKERTHD